MNNKNKIIITLTVAVLVCASAAFAASNSLVQVDVKKSSPDSVNLTLYTSDNYNNSVMVRQKSSNKYVVLIPNITSDTYTPDFHAVKDLVTDVNVKSIDTPADNYTKITLITKKPITIKTKTVKTNPVTPEQKAYRSLLAQANTPKANSIKTVSKPVVNTSTGMINQTGTPKKTVTKVSTKYVEKNFIQKTKEALFDRDNNSQNLKLTNVKNQNNIKVKNSKAKDAKNILIATKTSDVKPVKVKSNKVTVTNQTVLPKVTTSKENIKTQKVIQDSILKPINEPQNNIKTQKNVEVTKTKVAPLPKNLAKEQRKANFISNFNTYTNSVKTFFLAKVLPVIFFVIIPILGLLYFAKVIKEYVEKSKDLRAAFIDKIKQESNKKEIPQYTEISDDKNLSWREKYQKYNEAVSKSDKKKPKKQHKPTFMEALKDKRKSLENMFNSHNEDSAAGKLHSEDDIIISEMSSNSRLKGFAPSRKLKVTDRHRVQGRFARYETPMAHIEEQDNELALGTSMLHKNLRKLNDANLNVFDVKKKIKSIKELKRIEDLKNQDYVISSLDEYLSVVDEEVEKNKQIYTDSKTKAKEDIIKNLSNIKQPIIIPKEENSVIDLNKAYMTKPISNTRKNETNVAPSNLSISTSYDIDKEHGFYVVNVDGKSALIGRANEEVFVLKQFDRIMDKPIQVRRDKDNIYMVKTEGFKSLVEVNDNKVGVLIEL